VEMAARVCHADVTNIYRVQGDTFRNVARRHTTQFPPTMPLGAEFPIVPECLNGRAILERRTVHYAREDGHAAAHLPAFHAHGRSRGAGHVAVAVPLLSQGEAIGTIQATRESPRPFSANEIAQLETFADQAVIAIENARLYGETRGKAALEERQRLARELH